MKALLEKQSLSFPKPLRESLLDSASRSFVKTFPSRLLICAKLLTCRLLFFSMFLTHLLACPCGSIMSGHLRAFATTIPFSIENESFGRPAMSHSRVLTASPRTEVREKVGDRGICSEAQSATHFSTISCRYLKSGGFQVRNATSMSVTCALSPQAGSREIKAAFSSRSFRPGILVRQSSFKSIGATLAVEKEKHSLPINHRERYRERNQD